MPLTKEEQAALNLHNQARREAPGGKRPPLVWSIKLASEAAAYARKQAEEGVHRHDRQNAITKQGENLHFLSHWKRTTAKDPRPTYIPQPQTLAQAVRSWLNEKRHYKGQKIKLDDPTGVEVQWGHYCTIVWPEANEVGMARFVVPPGDKRYKLQGTFFVAKYDVSPLVGFTAWSGVRDEVMELNNIGKSFDEPGKHVKSEVIINPDGTKVTTRTVTQFIMVKHGESSSSGGKPDSKSTGDGKKEVLRGESSKK